MSDPLIPRHGGYQKLKSFQLAQLIYDVTYHFCNRYIDKRSRTHDQMVQAARSGVQNIAEGSQVSGTSRKSELKLTNVARGSLEELRADYRDYLRQRSLRELLYDHPALLRFKARQCASLEDVRAWVQCERQVHGQTQTNTDIHGRTQTPPRSDELAANAALSLLNLACYLLDKQLAAQAAAFENEGGFTERLYRKRSEARRKQQD